MLIISTTSQKLITILCMLISFCAVLYCAYLSFLPTSSNNCQTIVNTEFYDRGVWKETHWLGVPMQQNPCDNQAMQELLFEIKPDVLIEAGTLYGGSALYYATLLDQFKPTCKIFTIDIEPHIQEASKYRVWKEHVISLIGNSTDPATINEVKRRIPKNAVVLVTLDSDHHRNHVYDELKMYSQLVTPGSYLVLQDTNINGHPVLKDFGPGPMEALGDFLKENHNFEPQRNREKYILTFYPRGWLKRVH